MLGWLPQGVIEDGVSKITPFSMPCKHDRGSLLSTYMDI